MHRFGRIVWQVSQPRRRAAALHLAVSLLLVAGCERPEAPAAAPDGAAAGIVRRPPERRVLLLAMDGVEWRIVEPLLAAGELPNLAALIERGASGKLATFLPTLSPVVWTSVITGRKMRDHGIRSFWRPVPASESRPAQADRKTIEQLKALGYIGGSDDVQPAPEQEMVLYGSESRRVKALWNILTEQGMSSDSIGWWITHPPEPINGRMISDRYLYNRFKLAAAERGETYEARGAVYPPELEAEIRPLVEPYDAVEPAEMQQFIHGELSLGDSLKLHAVEDELRVVYAKDESTWNIAEALLKQRVPDLFCLYVQGTDVTSHYFWKYRWPQEWQSKYGETIDERERKRYGDVIDAYYELQDRHLGRLLESIDLASTTLILASDHGFVTGKRDQQMRGAASTISGVHATQMPPGFILLAGAGIRPGTLLGNAHVLDIAPTILTLLGLPVAQDMDGKVLTAALDDSVISGADDIRYVRSYETPGD